MRDQRQVWLNGQLIPWENATVHILSHGFSRGSAIFEVFGIHPLPAGPAAFRLDLHLRRFARTAQLLGMELAQSQEELAQAVAETVRANKMDNGFIKMVAYYGLEAFATLVPGVKLDLSVFAVPASADLGLDLSKPISACISKWRKIHPETVPVAAKAASNYLNGMLARQDALRRGFDVGLMMDTHGFMAEGSIEAFFMAKNGVLLTPPLGRILASVSRQSVLDAARVVGIEAHEKALRPEELLEADEIFTSATPFKVLPVGRIEDRKLDDAPGPVSRGLIQLMDAIVAGRDERFKDWLQPLP
ncbi:MAG: aminotransferase class IV [Desulfobacterales bacterium]|nr:MAG: aminotransferase class IV [Desulfobacterales bacterium]